MEGEIDSLLRSHGLNDLWMLAAELAQRGITPPALQPLFERLDVETVRAALVRIAASLEIASLLKEIESSTSRIADLVGAYPQFAPAVHGVNGIVDYVGPNLVQLTAERIHQEGHRLIITLDLDAALKLMVQDGQRSFQALYDVDILHGSLVHVCVLLDRA